MAASFALLLAVTSAAAASPDAAARQAPSGAACGVGSKGVTVVVDFGNLPGGVQIRCVTEPVTSGFDALVKAGFTYAGTQRFPGLLCRIDGKPADDPCVNAPPSDRYWAYWTAAQPGGAWTYSDLGGGNRKPPPGSVEGWAFSDGCTRAPQGPPCSSPTTTTRPRATTTTTAAGGSGGGTTGAAGGSPTTAGAAGSPDAETTSTETPSEQTTTTEVPPGGTAPEPGEEGHDGDGTDEQQAAALTGDDENGSGSAGGVLVGLGVVAGLGALAVVTARRRGAGEEPA